MSLSQVLDPNPFVEFGKWFQAAQESGLATPEAMTLATASPSGMPSARIVLLKRFDETGFVFFTNYESRKAREISANSRVALVCYWETLTRQVRIEGQAYKTTRQESHRYFCTRPLESRLAAWASQQSTPLADKSMLEIRMAELRIKYASGDVPLPPAWGGYRVVPERIEFWINKPGRLHDRFCYVRQPGGTWLVIQLMP